MIKSKYLTPWYPNYIKPIRQGKYLLKSVLDGCQPFYAWWDGKHWLCERYSYYPMSFQDREWRGLKGKAQEK